MTASTVDAPARSQLTNADLLVLESTLRVQLRVAKHVRVAHVTSAVGAVVLSGPLAALPSGYTIVTSHVQRRKLRRRHRDVTREMEARGGLTPAIADAKPLGKRAYALSMATGFACCVLAFAADVLIDHAVVQVVSEVLMNEVDDMAIGALATHVTTQITAPLKSTRSWGGFASTWKAARMRRKAESLPPDLFGERERGNQHVGETERLPPDRFGERAQVDSDGEQHVEVHRTRAFTVYGECLVLRFSTVVPGDEALLRRTSIVGDADALSELQWQSLWTLEDGPIDMDTDDYDLFGPMPTKEPAFDECDLFGGAERETYDLFGLYTPKST